MTAEKFSKVTTEFDVPISNFRNHGILIDVFAFAEAYAKQELDSFKEDLKNNSDWYAENKTLQKQVDELKKYADHRFDCPCYAGYRIEACNCGYREALNE